MIPNKFYPPKSSHTAGYITMLVQTLHFIMHVWMKTKREREYKVSTKHEPALISKGKLETGVTVSTVFDSLESLKFL